MSKIKARRLRLPVSSRPGLFVGSCVPFYFCPRSVMLYLLHKANDPELNYRGGQEPVLHLELDLNKVAAWADANGKRWAFTLSNAGAYYFEDFADLEQLDKINWAAVNATKWAGQGVSTQVKEGKQAEFLVEGHVPWELIERIGVISNARAQTVATALAGATHRPIVEIRANWY
jgi:hypothetical protein